MTAAILIIYRKNFAVCFFKHSRFFRRDNDIVHTQRRAEESRIVIPDGFELIEHLDGNPCSLRAVHGFNQLADLLIIQSGIDKRNSFRHLFVKGEAAGCRFNLFTAVLNLYQFLPTDGTGLCGHHHLGN